MIRYFRERHTGRVRWALPWEDDGIGCPPATHGVADTLRDAVRAAREAREAAAVRASYRWQAETLLRLLREAVR